MLERLEAIKSALANYLPNGNAITGVSQISAGFSNGTFILEGVDQILRLPPETTPLLAGHDVVGQAKIYQALNRMPAAPAVPEVSTVCEDPSILGSPFFVMERLRGSAIEEMSPEPWFTEGPPALRESICRQWVEAIGHLAHLAPIDVLGPPKTPEEEARYWRQMALDSQAPELVAAFDRLLAVPAPRSGPPSVIHGDAKIANMLWNDGKLSAVLDWELAYNGEPLFDLGYLLYFFKIDDRLGIKTAGLEGMLNRDQVIATWSEASGRSAEGVGWHEVSAIGTIAAITARGFHLFSTGQITDRRYRHHKIGYELATASMLEKLESDPWFAAQSTAEV